MSLADRDGSEVNLGFGLPEAPYPGLRAFEAREWRTFHGREAATSAIVDQLAETQFVMVHGDSGSGKSSLIRAGVLPWLEQDQKRSGVAWRTETLFPGNAPLDNLVRALENLDAQSENPLESEELQQILSLGKKSAPLLADKIRRGKEDNFCLLIDQFEELFDFARKSESVDAQLLVEFLVGIEEEKPPGLYAICTMRSEFLGRCSSYPGLAEAVNHTQYLVPRMPKASLVRAIRRPAALFGGQVDEQLAEQLIDDVAGDQDQLPLLQHALAHMYQAAVVQKAERHEDSSSADEGDWVLTKDDLKGRSAGQMLSNHVDDVLQGIIEGALEADRERRRRIVKETFKALTDVNSDGHAIRRRLEFQELVAVTGADPKELNEVLKPFRAEGVSFLRPYGAEPLGPKDSIDITHESLIRSWKQIGTLEDNGWLHHEFEDGLAWKNLLFQATPDALLPAATTQERAVWIEGRNEPWAARYGGGWEAVTGLIGRSVKSVRRQTRVNARWLWGAVAVAVVMAGLSFFAWRQSAIASDNERIANEQRTEAQMKEAAALAAISSAVLEDDPADALKLALAAWPRSEVDTSPQTLAPLEAFRTALAVSLERAELRHDRPVSSAAFSPDGNRIVTASDNDAWLWNATTGAEIAVFSGHQDTVWNAAFSPDGNRIVTASNDRTARVWDATTGAEIMVLSGHDGVVLNAVFSPDGSRIVTASNDDSARLWDATTGEVIEVLSGHLSSVQNAAFSPDGTRIVTASDDRTARIWDATTGAEIVVLRGHNAFVSDAVFSPNGARVVTTSGDRTARVWDATTGTELVVLSGLRDSVLNAAFSPDGTRIVTAMSDTALLWDATTGAEIAALSGHRDAVLNAAFSPDGARIVTASGDATARLWDATTGAELAVLAGHQDSVRNAAFSPDGTRIVTASDDNTARLWDPTTESEIAIVSRHTAEVGSAAFSPDGARFITASHDHTVWIWDALTAAELAVLGRHTRRVRSAAFSPDSTMIATASDDRTARVWDAMTGAEIAVLNGHQEAVWTAAFSPDGARIVTASADNTARIWDASTGAELEVLARHQDIVRNAVFSSDGTRIVTASDDRTARVWDATVGAEIAVLRGHQGSIQNAAFSPDGTRIVTASADATARLWDVATGTEIAVLSGHRGTIMNAAFSPDGTRIVTASSDNTARLWDATVGAEIAVLGGHQDWVLNAAFSHDGTRVVTTSKDATARIWDATTGAEIAILRGHQGSILGAAFSPDGTRIVTASADATARTWDIDDSARLSAFQIACDRLPDFDLTGVASGYGIVIDSSICADPPPSPSLALFTGIYRNWLERLRYSDTATVMTLQDALNQVEQSGAVPVDGALNTNTTRDKIASVRGQLDLTTLQPNDQVTPDLLSAIHESLIPTMPIDIGESAGGQLQKTVAMTAPRGAYAVCYTLSGDAGQEVVVALESQDFDTYLEFGPMPPDGCAYTGALAEVNDDGGDGKNSLLVATLAADGDYLIRVSSYEGGMTGGYSVRVSAR